MKSIEFSLPLEEGGQDSAASKNKSLEVLLLEKNKSLQAETTQLKVANTDINGKLFNNTVVWLFMSLLLFFCGAKKKKE